MSLIEQTIDEHPGSWACSCSGGKDSTALLDLCVRAGWHGPVFFFVCAETPQENVALVRGLVDRYHLPLHSFTVPGAWDVYEEVGHFFAYPTTEEERRATNAMLRGYKRVADEEATQAGYTGLFWGMRMPESPQRGMALARKGACYRVLNRTTWTCNPLIHWTARDVWAYLVSNDLPWLERYDTAADRERERSEVTWLAAEALWRRGQGQKLRYTDPETFNDLLRKFPMLQWFT